MDLFNQLAEILKTVTPEEILALPILNHHYDLAYRAYCGTSFSPERGAQSNVKEISDMLEADLLQVPENYKVKYQSKFEGFYTSWLHSKTRCMSTMITGPANFPAERMKKYNQWEDNKYNDFMAWRKRILAALARSERKRTQGSELEQAVNNLAEAKRIHAGIKAASTILRKTKTKDAAILVLKEANLWDDKIVITGDVYIERYGLTLWGLTNALSKVKRLEQRVKELQAKEDVKEQIQQGTKEIPEITINGAIIRQDFTDNRLKIIFEDKPAPHVIAALNKSGFNWSRFMGCWCRKLTNNAVYAAKMICTQELQPTA